MAKNRYEFQINDNNYVLVTEREKEETDKIVRYVDNKIAEAKKNLKYKNREMQATLACLNIANDLYDSEKSYSELKELSREPLEKYEPLKEKYESYLLETKDSRETINSLNAKVKEFERLLSYMTSERDKFKLELDRQIKLSEKSIEDNNRLKERLLEQEKLTLQANKQIQELIK